jgi:hypothetical protein
MISPYKSLRIDATTREEGAAREGGRRMGEMHAGKRCDAAYAAGVLAGGRKFLAHTKVMSKTDYLFFPQFCLC